VHIIEGQPAR
jgi:superfamily II DNA helicase RecQ